MISSLQRSLRARLSRNEEFSQSQYLILQTSLSFQLLFFFIFLSTTGMLNSEGSEIAKLSTRNKLPAVQKPLRTGPSKDASLSLPATELFLQESDQILAVQIKRLDDFFRAAATKSGEVWLRYQFVPEAGSLYQQNSIWNDALLRLATLQRFATDRGISADRINAGAEPGTASTDSNETSAQSMIQIVLHPINDQELEEGF